MKFFHRLRLTRIRWVLTNYDSCYRFRSFNAGLTNALRAVISIGTALHLTTRGMYSLARCQAEPCDAVVVDTTRNGRQRYCSVRCANRAAVRRHRSRQSPA